MPKSPLYMGMETLCNAKKTPIYGHGDTLQCQKAAYICGHGNTLHCQKAPYVYGHGDNREAFLMDPIGCNQTISFVGQVAMSALGSGRTCSPQLSSPTVHFVHFQHIQVHRCVPACFPSLNGLGCAMPKGMYTKNGIIVVSQVHSTSSHCAHHQVLL